MTDTRYGHSCLVDESTSSIYVIGGFNKQNMDLSTTEKWIFGMDSWVLSTNLPVSVGRSSAVSSKSGTYIGYIAGGWAFGIDEHSSNKIWGLRRMDLTWIEMAQTLKIGRQDHSIVNVPADEIFQLRPNIKCYLNNILQYELK